MIFTSFDFFGGRAASLCPGPASYNSPLDRQPFGRDKGFGDFKPCGLEYPANGLAGYFHDLGPACLVKAF